MPRVTFITEDGKKIVIENAEGSLMEAALEHGVDGIDADCGGVCSCATCHVHVAPEWIDRVGPAEGAELDTLEFSSEPRPCSRLSCQVELAETLDGLVVRVAPRD